MSISVAEYRRGFAGSIRRQELVEAGTITANGVVYEAFVCPACGKGCGHVATRRSGFRADGPFRPAESSDVLHCWETGQRWLIRTSIPDTISEEEHRFAAILDEWSGRAGERVSAADAFRWYTERGVPPELFEVDNYQEFDRLMHAHSEKSRP